MKQILHNIRTYLLQLITVGVALLLVASWLLPNRVLDTYEMNLTGSEDKEWMIALSEGSDVSYTMNTGNRPLRGIQPGISLQGGQFAEGQIRCQVYTEPSHTLVSDNAFPLSELTHNMQANLDAGADPALSMEAMYTYIPFTDYQACEGDIVLVFTYESRGEQPSAFAGVDAGEVIVPGILVNSVQKDQTKTSVDGEILEGGLCGYTVYTHNTYPLLYDLRLLFVVLLAASMAVSLGAPVFGKKLFAREDRREQGSREQENREGHAEKAHVAEVDDENAHDKKVCGEKADVRKSCIKKGIKIFVTCVSVVLAAGLMEGLLFNRQAVFGERYTEQLLGNPTVTATMEQAEGREKLTAEEENTVRRNRENAKILAELQGTEYVEPDAGEVVEEEDGLYRKVKRTWMDIELPEERYIQNLHLTLADSEDGEKVRVSVDGENLVSDGWVDERIGAGNYRIDRVGQTLRVELTGTTQAQITSLEIGNEFQWNPVRFVMLLSVFGLVAFWMFAGKPLFTEHPEVVFACCSLLLGSVLIYAVGLNQIGYDEHIHMKAAYERSFGATIQTTESAMQMEGSTMPSFQNWKERKLVEAYAQSNHDYSWANITHQSRFPDYTVRSYLQISLFFWLARMLKLPFVWCMMLGKFGNLVLYTLICSLAIRLAKQEKILVTALALLPNSIFAAASFSYDGVVNSFLLLAMVLTFRQMMSEEPVNWLQTIAMLGAFVAGSTAKPIYIFMAFLMLLFPVKKFKGRLPMFVYKLCVVALMGLLLYTFFFPPVSASSNYEVMGNLAYAGDKRSQGTNVLGQIGWVLHNPLSYTLLLLRSMFGELWNYLCGAKPFVAYGYLGGLPVFWTWIGLAMLLFAAAFSPAGEERRGYPLRYKVGNLLVVFGMSSVIWTSMYVTFTAVGANVINGVQGRYFLPLFLPFFGCLIRGGHQVRLEKSTYARLILGVFVCMNLYGIWTLAGAPCNF